MSEKYITDRQTFVNQDTGTKINGLVKIVECDRDNFDILYLMSFANIFDEIGGKKYEILKYILCHRNSENMVIITTRELAEKTKTSTNTVTKTLNALKKANAITTKTGVIMVNPKMIVHGGKKKEDWIFTKFVEMQNNNTNKNGNDHE